MFDGGALANCNIKTVWVGLECRRDAPHRKDGLPEHASLCNEIRILREVLPELMKRNGYTKRLCKYLGSLFKILDIEKVLKSQVQLDMPRTQGSSLLDS